MSDNMDQNEPNLEQWVDEKMDTLDQGGDWNPNPRHAIGRFRERAESKPRWKGFGLAAIVGGAACVVVLALPWQVLWDRVSEGQSANFSESGEIVQVVEIEEVRGQTEETDSAGTETEVADIPILSPDGEWIAYESNGNVEVSKIEVTGGAASTGQGVIEAPKCLREVYVQGVLRCEEWGVIVAETEGVRRQTVETDSAGTEPGSVTVTAPVTAPLSELQCLRQAFVQGILTCAEWGVGPGIGTVASQGVGEGSPVGGEAFRIGGGVSAPTVISQVEPEYPEEARRLGYEGTVVLEAIVRADGSVEVVRVRRSLGYGLDEKAIEALQQWKFRPGMRDGQAVPVALNIEVNFNFRK